MVAPNAIARETHAMSDQTDVTDPVAEDNAYVLERKDVSAILYAVDIEDRAQLTKLMEPLHAADIADLLEQDTDRALVEQSLAFPEYSAGRLMQREVVMAPEHWTVGEAIDRLRSADESDLPNQF